MNATHQIALALVSVGVLLGLMALVKKLAEARGINAEVQRKLVHIGTGLYALGLPWLFPDRWPIYMLIGMTLLVMLFLRLPGSKLGHTLHGVERQSYGDLLLAVSVGLCLFLAGDRLFLYVLPIAVLTLADAAAALAGSTYGTRFFQIEEGQKSIEGSVVFFVVTLLISVLCLLVMTPFAPVNIVVLSLMVAAFGTLVEAASWRGYDNLFLPMGLLIFLSVHAANPLADLLILAVIFAVSILAFKLVSPRIGLNNHAAQVYVTAVFLLLAFTAVQNTLAPILVLAAHVWSRSTNKSRDRFPELDVVAGLALVSFGWLAIGEATGLNAVSFYGMTASAMIMGFAALAVAPLSRTSQAVIMLGMAAALLTLRAAVVALNPEPANWNGPMWPVTVASLLIPALVALSWSRQFEKARAMRVTLASLAIPLVTYLIAIVQAGAFA
ncbi:MAG: hypothetical protein HKN18_13930 [Silicimonas sp.]|nr:hypothetical protein [Silicimonas sp.]